MENSESPSHSRNKFDDLKDLKEGDIFVDENGKRYKVRKSMLPMSSVTGPHGEALHLGDPDDRTLRRLEADVLIPNRMNSEIERVECHDQYMDLVNCMRKEGDIKGLNLCKSSLSVFNVCKKSKFEDLSFRQMITDRYLAERAELRRTGKSPNMRRLEAYREWKKQHNSDLENGSI